MLQRQPSALKKVEARRRSRSDRLQSLAQRAFLGDIDAAALPFAPGAHELSDLVAKTAGETLARAHKAALWVGAAPGEDADSRVTAIVRAIGIPRASDAAMRAFALALTSFDVTCSTALNQEAGVLARRLGVPQRESLTESWSAFVIDASKARLDKVLEAVLDWGDSASRAPLIAALQLLMADALGLKQSGAQKEAPLVVETQPRRTRLRVTEDLSKELVDVISANWTLDDLREDVAKSTASETRSLCFAGIAPTNRK